jgi:hypothetical protein
MMVSRQNDMFAFRVGHKYGNAAVYDPSVLSSSPTQTCVGKDQPLEPAVFSRFDGRKNARIKMGCTSRLSDAW